MTVGIRAMADGTQAPRDGSGKIIFNRDHKFDIQLSRALIDERRLAEVFSAGRLEKIELKTEQWLWQQTGNICVEYARDGQPTGISTTEADFWVHELLAEDGSTVGYFMLPLVRLKELCRGAHKAGRYRHGAGDGARQSVILLSVKELFGMVK